MKFLAAVTLLVGCLQLSGGLLTPITGVPDWRTFQWETDEFSRQEVRDGKTFFVVDVPQGKEGGVHGFITHFNVQSITGRYLTWVIRYRVTGVSEPDLPYLGSKFLINYNFNGSSVYPEALLKRGTHDWETALFTVEIPQGVTEVLMHLGLQNSSGKIEYEMDSFEIGIGFSPENRKNLDYIVKYPEKVRNHPRLRGAMFEGHLIPEQNFQTFVEWNGNLIRAQITRNWGRYGTDLDVEEYLNWFEMRLKQIDENSKTALKYGMKIVIDLHSPPGGRIDPNNMRMFYDPQYADAYLECWRRIASRFKDNPAIFAYDLLNEPVQSLPSGCDYWELQRRAAEEIRKIDPDTPIIFESNESARARTFAYLSPIRMNNIIYQAHMYEPTEYTHQRLNGENGPIITYPGIINGEMWNKERLRKEFQPVREFQLRHNCIIYVGEFGVVTWAPGAEQYLKDCIELFEEYGWHWSYHAFREWEGFDIEKVGNAPGQLETVPMTPRKKVILDAFKLNHRFSNDSH